VKRFLASLLTAIMIAGTFLVPPPLVKAEEDSGESLPAVPATMFDPSESPNKYYFVALFWVPIWRNNAGKWSPFDPGGTRRGMSFPISSPYTVKK
jgi:hypothetical protein